MATPYSTLDDADAWFSERRIAEWEEAPSEDRKAVLLRASEWLDRYFVFAGTPENPEQTRAWPRKNLTLSDGRSPVGIPEAVLEAVYLIALALLDSDEAAETAIGIGARISEQKLGGVTVSFNDSTEQQTRIQKLLAPYLLQHRERSVRRG